LGGCGVDGGTGVSASGVGGVGNGGPCVGGIACDANDECDGGDAAVSHAAYAGWALAISWG